MQLSFLMVRSTLSLCVEVPSLKQDTNMLVHVALVLAVVTF